MRCKVAARLASLGPEYRLEHMREPPEATTAGRARDSAEAAPGSPGRAVAEHPEDTPAAVQVRGLAEVAAAPAVR